jgi:hypothetical protein
MRWPPAKHKAKLIVAKLDRLSRSVEFTAALMNSKVVRDHSMTSSARARSVGGTVRASA